MAQALVGRFDGVNCANNVHYGDAIADSLSLLDEIGIAHCGAGRDYAEAHRPTLIESGGASIAVLGYTSVFWPVGAAATQTRPGVATIKAYTSYQPHPRFVDMPGVPATVRTQPDEGQLGIACSDVLAARQRADFVVVYCHWGVVNSPVIAEYQHAVGRALIDSGASLVVGSSPHVPQGVEQYQRGVILHSLGNFMFGAEHHREFSRTGLLARVQLDGGGVSSLEIIPVARNDNDQIELLSGAHGEGAEIAEFVASESRETGTKARATPDGVQITVS
jgi:poly-gamma-glutamate synthesis protein (capsule biosynthesis protein)